MIGRDHPDTARFYEAFCAAHPRSRAANESLAWHAASAPHHRVLDVGAGKPSCMLLPASSSMWTRVMPVRLRPPSTSTSTHPCSARGWSNCEI
jgi:hypothetical protein